MDDPVLNEYVGEGKKFKTVEDLAKGKKESDRFIDQLQMEKDALRKELETFQKKAQEGATLQDLLDKMNNKAETTSDDVSGNQSSLQSDEIKKLLETAMNEREAANKRRSNREAANNFVSELFAQDKTKAEQFLEGLAKDLGVSKDWLNTLAETSPVAYKQLINPQKKNVGTQSATSLSSTNTEALGSLNPGDNQEAYFIKLKRENSKTFWNPRTQQELYKFGETYGQDALRKILYS